MKETIAFSQLVELVAKKANTSARMSELFLQELFAIVTQSLAAGEAVKIKGLGAFNVKPGDNGKDVCFTPDKSLAEAVNAPFAQFKAVELCDAVTDERLAEIDASMERQPEPEPVAEVQEDVVEEKEEVVPIPETNIEDTSEPVATVTAPFEEVTSEDSDDSLHKKTISAKWWIIALASVVAIALIALVLLKPKTETKPDQNVAPSTEAPAPTPTSVTADSIVDAPKMNNDSIAEPVKVKHAKKGTVAEKKHKSKSSAHRKHHRHSHHHR